jgi:type I restriction enzyme M protein
VYEYFLTRFASAEGKNAGAAKCEVRSARVEVKAAPQIVIRNSSFDICPARRLAFMNLAIRGIEADIGKEHADTFRHVQHPDLAADFLLASPMSEKERYAFIKI